jgi:small-conductance mechanosensitive channel
MTHWRRNPLPTRTKEWEMVGLGAEIDRREARRARGWALVLVVLIAATLVVFSHRADLFPGMVKTVRIITVVVLMILGWALAKELARGLGPALMRRMEPGTAGTVGFLLRLATILASLVAALRIAGVGASELALGGAFTAVVVGLAAQQTIGNVFAGLIMITARPFRVGDRLRVYSGQLGGTLEGTVGAVGLIHVALVTASGRILVPNSLLMQVGIEPVAEPERVDVRARFGPEVTPADVQRWLEESVTVVLRYPADISLEELDSESVTVRIRAVPADPAEGVTLTTQVLRGVRRGAGTAAVEAGTPAAGEPVT